MATTSFDKRIIIKSKKMAKKLLSSHNAAPLQPDKELLLPRASLELLRAKYHGHTPRRNDIIACGILK